LKSAYSLTSKSDSAGGVQSGYVNYANMYNDQMWWADYDNTSTPFDYVITRYTLGSQQTYTVDNDVKYTYSSDADSFKGRHVDDGMLWQVKDSKDLYYNKWDTPAEKVWTLAVAAAASGWSLSTGGITARCFTVSNTYGSAQDETNFNTVKLHNWDDGLSAASFANDGTKYLTNVSIPFKAEWGLITRVDGVASSYYIAKWN